VPDDAELLSRARRRAPQLAPPAERLASFERALFGRARSFDALGNLRHALIKLNRPLEALSVFDRALTVVPGNAQLLTNRAVGVGGRLDRRTEAVMSARRALVTRPDFAQHGLSRPWHVLTLGEFAAVARL